MYTSKTTQNDFLKCIKDLNEEKITSQSYGSLFGIQIDEVKDFVNIEELGIIVQYVFEKK